MRQHARLCWDAVALDDLVHHAHQPHHLGHVVRRRVDADHRVSAAVQQAVEQAGRNAGSVIRRVVGLQPGRQASGQTNGASKRCDHLTLFGHQDQVLVAHDFGHRRRHFRRDARRHRRQGSAVHCVAEQPVAKVTHRQMRYRPKRHRVVRVNDVAGDFVVLVGHHCLVEQCCQRHIGQRHLGHYAFFGRGRRHTRQLVPRSQRCGFGEQLFQVLKPVGDSTHGVAKCVSGHVRCCLPVNTTD